MDHRTRHHTFKKFQVCKKFDLKKELFTVYASQADYYEKQGNLTKSKQIWKQAQMEALE